MTQPLEDYYERELKAFAELTREFARRYPAEAGRLLPETDRPVDPHLERFIEGFTLLAGRLRHKLDSEFPELSEALLKNLYPHMLAPVPSMTTVQFRADPAAIPAQGTEIPKHSRLRTRRLGLPPLSCQWRTGYPVTLWPVQLTSAQVLANYFPTGVTAPPRTAAALVLQLECLGAATFADLPLDRLRLFLNGDRQMIASLYEILFNHTSEVVLRGVGGAAAPRSGIVLPAAECLFQVGLEPDEGLLPMPEESFPGYRILTEFFSFREKFLYLDLGGWRQAAENGFGKKVEVILFLNRVEENLKQGVTAKTFLLGCTPVINLFAKSAEPLAVTHKATEYRVVPSRTVSSLGMEVFSVDAVTALDPARGEIIPFQPFYAFGQGAYENGFAFWHAARRPSFIEGDTGTEVYLSLADSGFDPRQPAEAVLHVQTTCTNRDWPSRYQRSGEALYLEPPAEFAGTILCLQSPTAPLRSSLRRGTYWRLLSQNNLNHMSLTDASAGLQALQEMLRICDFADPKRNQELSKVHQKVIDGITALSCRPATAAVAHGPEVGYVRGLEVTVEFDEKSYVGIGMFLFACVLERFLGQYTAVNSFSQLVAKTKQAEGYFKRWPPRAAHDPVR